MLGRCWLLAGLVVTSLVVGCGRGGGGSQPGKQALPLTVREEIAGLAPDSAWPALSPSVASSEAVSRRALGWTYRGKAGELVTVHVRTSGFHPRVFLADAASGRLHILDETSAGDSLGGAVAGGARKGTSAVDSPVTESGARAVDSLSASSSAGSVDSLSLELPRDGSYFVIVGARPAPANGSATVELTTEPVPVFKTGGNPRGRYALLVGVGDYPGVEHDLPGVGTDLALMKKLLVETYGWPSENVLVLQDKRASRRRVMDAFLQHLGQAGPDGTALFYFSGHGRRLAENVDLVGALDPEPDGRDEALYLGDGSILLDDEVGVLADRLSSRRVLLILDSCYSGTGSRGQGFWLKRVREDSTLAPLPQTYVGLSPDSIPGGGGSMPGGAASTPGGAGIEDLDTDRHLLLAASAEDEPAGVVAGLPGMATPASAFTFNLTRFLEENRGPLTFRQLLDAVRTRTHETEPWSDVPAQTPQLHGNMAAMQVSEFLGKKR